MSDKLIQYILLRKDLITKLKWPIGSLVAQGCHASVAALSEYKDDSNTIAYLSDIPNMTKIVLQIEKKLTERQINFYTWLEQPELTKTCIALKPYTKEQLKNIISNLPLFR